MEKTKQCIVCNTQKKESDFWKRSDNGKARNTCKNCQKNQAISNRDKKNK